MTETPLYRNSALAERLRFQAEHPEVKWHPPIRGGEPGWWADWPSGDGRERSPNFPMPAGLLGFLREKFSS